MEAARLRVVIRPADHPILSKPTLWVEAVRASLDLENLEKTGKQYELPQKPPFRKLKQSAKIAGAWNLDSLPNSGFSSLAEVRFSFGNPIELDNFSLAAFPIGNPTHGRVLNIDRRLFKDGPHSIRHRKRLGAIEHGFDDRDCNGPVGVVAE